MQRCAERHDLLDTGQTTNFFRERVKIFARHRPGREPRGFQNVTNRAAGQQISVGDVLKSARLSTWAVTGENLHALAEKIRGLSGVEQVVAFGTTLHVSGRDAEKLRASISPWMIGAYRWEKIDSGLEDVFISLMETAKDNFS